MARLLRRPWVDEEIVEIGRHIARDDLAAALRVVDQFDQDMTMIAEHPRIGHRLNTTDPRLGDIRVWVLRGYRNYLIVYQPLDDGADVLHVLHGARDAETLLRQLERRW